MSFLSDAHILSLLNPATGSLGASSGNITLTLDTNTNYNSFPQTGVLNFSSSSFGNVEGVTKIVTIDANGSAITSDPNFINGNGTALVLNKRNIISFVYIQGQFLYFPVITNIPSSDITPPTYSIQGISAISTYSASFNVQINKNGAVRYIVTNSATSPTKSQILAGTGAIGGNFGNLSVTGGVTAILTLNGLSQNSTYYLYSYAVDSSLNESSVQSGLSFSTLVLVNTKSISFGSGGISSTGLPANLKFGNGSSDSDFSIAFDVKLRSTITQNNFICILHNSGYTNAAYQLYINTAGSLAFNVITDYSNNDYIVSFPLPTFIWNRIVARYTASTKTLDFYLNNALLTSGLTHVGSFTFMANAASDWPLTIGLNATNILLDNFMVINKKLSTSEMSELYNGGIVKVVSSLSFYSNIQLSMDFENNIIDSSTNAYLFGFTNAPTYLSDVL